MLTSAVALWRGDQGADGGGPERLRRGLGCAYPVGISARPVAVQLEQVVYGALGLTLLPGGGFAADQQLAGVLGGVQLAEDRFDDRFRRA